MSELELNNADCAACGCNADDLPWLPRERINGIVMNIDRWYELFDVKFGNILYLTPETRARIW